MLVDYTSSSKPDLCTTATVVKHGLVECYTKPMVQLTDIDVGIKDVYSGTVYAHAGNVADVKLRTFDAVT